MKAVISLPIIGLLAACGNTPEAPQTSVPAAELDVATAQATCRHGDMPNGGSFIVCKDGVTKLPVFRSALRGPVDPSLEIKQVANQFDMPPQVFTGIEAATYSSLVPTKETTSKQSMTPYDSVRVDGKAFDVYHAGLGSETGTIFIERK